MSDNQKRLENALLDFIEKTVKEPMSEEDIKILPAVAHELIILWSI
jgi:uncharacterized protein YeeX (DUF496 family)